MHSPRPPVEDADGVAIVSFTVRGLSKAMTSAYVRDAAAADARSGDIVRVSVARAQRTAGVAPKLTPRTRAAGGSAAVTAAAGGADDATHADSARWCGQTHEGDDLHEVSVADELAFALVGPGDGLGAWGRAPPVLLHEIESGEGEDEGDHAPRFRGHALVPLRFLQSPTPDAQPALPCRLVLVRPTLLRTPPPIVVACPGAAIVAVDNAHTYPRSATLRRVTMPLHVSLAEAGAALSDPSQVEMLLHGEESWEAVLDITAPPPRPAHPSRAAAAAAEVEAPAVHFARADDHFPFLRTLPRASPSSALSQRLHSTAATAAAAPAGAGAAAAAACSDTQRGPFLSLTLYGSDPQKSFQRQRWLDSLPAGLRAAVEEESSLTAGDAGSAAPPRTTAFDVARVRPVRMDGSCWCETTLPVPAPLQRRADEARRLREEARNAAARSPSTRQAAPSASTPVQSTPLRSHPPHTHPTHSASSSVMSFMGSTDLDDDGAVQEETRGWCAQPLRRAQPVVGAGFDSSRTQQCWSCLVDLSCLENYALEVTLEVPTELLLSATAPPRPHRVEPTDADGAAHANSSTSGSGGGAGITGAPSGSLPLGVSRHATVHGSTVLIASMFTQGTKGVFQAAVPCRVPSALLGSTTTPTPAAAAAMPSQLWVFLHVQYLFIYPYNNDHSSLEVVRSAQSYRRLTVPTLVGHRGLGKTYTRRGGPPRPAAASAGHNPMTKLAENSIESLNAAHRRGCEMVEFDVMLTLDHIPVIFHDPMLMLQAREKFSVLHGKDPARAKQRAQVAAKSATADDRHPAKETAAAGSGGREGNRNDTDDDDEDNDDDDDDGTVDVGGAVEEATSAGQDATTTTTTARARVGESAVLTKLQRYYLQSLKSFVPIPVAIHSLTKRQLDAVVTESFSFGGTSGPPQLKLLVLRHWLQLLRIYRNRARLRLMRDRALDVRPHDEDEFYGTKRLALTFGTQTAVAEAASPSTNAASPLHDPGAGAAAAAAAAGAAAVAAGSPTGMPARFADPAQGILPVLTVYKQQLQRANHFLERQEDITNRIPALHELFLLTPPTLRLDLEVKYPFMPLWDANLFLQTDAFEINGFVDAILDVVFAYADEGREIAFSSFEPDVCVALATKQSRYDVLFLCDTEEKTDLKDYRSFYVEGAVQFAQMHHLAGVSINAATLPCSARVDKSTAPCAVRVITDPGSSTTSAGSVVGTDAAGTASERGKPTARVPLVRELVRPLHTASTTLHSSSGSTIRDGTAEKSLTALSLAHQYDWTAGQSVVDGAHARALRVWTWGDANSDHLFDYIQVVKMGVDAVITDNVPV